MEKLKLGFSSSRHASFQLSSPVDGHLEEHFLGPVENASEARETISEQGGEEMADSLKAVPLPAMTKDSSPVRDYLSRFGKRSWSFDNSNPSHASASVPPPEGGIMTPSSAAVHSDSWRLFHELKGKITKTVEERLGDKFDNLNEKIENMKGIRMFQERLEKKGQAGFSRSFDEGDDALSGASSSAASAAAGTPSPALSVPSSPLAPETLTQGGETGISSELSSSLSRTPPQNSSGLASPSSGRFTFPGSLNDLRHRRKRDKEAASSLTTTTTGSSTSIAYSSLLREDTDGEREHDVAVSTHLSVGRCPSLQTDSTTARSLYGPPSQVSPSGSPLAAAGPRKRPDTLEMPRKEAGGEINLRAKSSPSMSRSRNESENEDSVSVRPRSTVTITTAAVAMCMIACSLYFGFAVVWFLCGFLTCLALRELVVPAVFGPAKIPKPSPLPDYSSMPPLTIESTEDRIEMESGVFEERPMPVYQGWMFEYPKDSWDPTTNRMKNLLPIYVRLEGSKLVLTGTRSKIPMRIMWNETALDPVFTSRREFDIAGCPVYLLPFTLSRTRLWNRKYPIVIDLRQPEQDTPETRENNNKGCDQQPKPEPEKNEKPAVDDPKEEKSTSKRLKGGGSTNSKKRRVVGVLHRMANKPNPYAESEASDIGSPDCDQSPNFELIDAGMCSQERLYIFARADREKEDWFRRLSAASKGLDLNGAVPSHSSTPLNKSNEENWSQRALDVWIDTLSSYYSPSVRQSRKMIDFEDYMRNIFRSQVLDDRVRINLGVYKGPRILRVRFKKSRGMGKSCANAPAEEDPVCVNVVAKGQNSSGKSPGQDEESVPNGTGGKTIQNIKRKAFHKLETAKTKTLDKLDGLISRRPQGIDLEITELDGEQETGVDSVGEDVTALDADLRPVSPLDTSSETAGFEASKASPEVVAATPDSTEGQDAETIAGSMFHTLHPTEVASHVRWLNCLLSRLMFDFLCDQDFEDMVRHKISSKLKNIRVPGVGKIACIDLDLGSSLPIIHRTSAPVMDERGFWIDFDISYGGGFRIAIEANIDLRTLGNDQDHQDEQQNASVASDDSPGPTPETASVKGNSDDEYSPSSEDEDGGGSTTIKRIFDRVTTSNYFKHVRELKYVKKGVEALAKTPLLLSVELIQVFGVLTINIPPPPADRVWWGFRKKPHLLISARPKVGQTAVNLSHLVELIEAKLLEQVDKFLVFPNMDDIIVPLMTPVSAQFLRAQSCIQVKMDAAKNKKPSFLSAS